MKAIDNIGRGTGRTAMQMLDAPLGAVFVWCNFDTIYPNRLAKALGRDDLVVLPLSWLKMRNVVGREFHCVVVDHAAHSRLDDSAGMALHYVGLSILARRKTESASCSLGF